MSDRAKEIALEMFAKFYVIEGRFKTDTKEACLVCANYLLEQDNLCIGQCRYNSESIYVEVIEEIKKI